MSDISTDAMMREAAMMDASDNHVWARKTRRLCIERDKLQARAEAAEARVKELEAQPAPDVAALVEAARKVVTSYWQETDGTISGIYDLERALAAMEGRG